MIVRSVLLVTADRELRKEMRASLEELPVMLAGEVTGTRGALERIRQDAVDIIIVDLFLGEASALDFLKALKKIQERALVILISRMNERSVVDRAFRYGAADVLPHPLGKDHLRETLKHRLDWLNGQARH